jgi:hypothetical protein
MERNDSQGYVDGTLSNNTIIGSLMTEQDDRQLAGVPHPVFRTQGNVKRPLA